MRRVYWLGVPDYVGSKSVDCPKTWRKKKRTLGMYLILIDVAPRKYRYDLCLKDYSSQCKWVFTANDMKRLSRVTIYKFH